jgi:hypothetical protein
VRGGEGWGKEGGRIGEFRKEGKEGGKGNEMGLVERGRRGKGGI